jgi:acetyl-CoA synthetase
MLEPAPDYHGLVARFRWRIPARYNIGVDVCDRWAAAEPGRAAVLDVAADGRVSALT